ncbi:MAG: rubrerythrin family protein [Candidatus Geothermincolia bacterium]
MGSQTEQNLKDSFEGEAKAVVRLRAFARKADIEEYEAVAKLFRAIAESESIHAYNSLKYMKVIKDTETNLQESLGREEKIAQVAYDRFVREAEADGQAAVATSFSYSRDVEERHAKLYEGALAHMVADSMPDYFVCELCGYVADAIVPESCPVCGAPPEKFFSVQ